MAAGLDTGSRFFDPRQGRGYIPQRIASMSLQRRHNRRGVSFHAAPLNSVARSGETEPLSLRLNGLADDVGHGTCPTYRMWTSRRGDLARYEKPRFRRMSKAARVTGNRPALSDARSGEFWKRESDLNRRSGGY